MKQTAEQSLNNFTGGQLDFHPIDGNMDDDCDLTWNTVATLMEEHASNELASYKAELRSKIDKILESDKQGMVDFKHNFSTYRHYEGRVCRLEDIKKALLEDNPTD